MTRSADREPTSGSRSRSPRPHSAGARTSTNASQRPVSARRVALDALGRIDGGAYANLAVRGVLEPVALSAPDRHFVTTLVNGVTRQRRALDFRIGLFAKGDLDAETRRILRLGAFQLTDLRVPAHAAVNESVQLAPRRSQGLVNAVLRRIAEAPEPMWPCAAVRLSYPDWIVAAFESDLGDDAIATLEAMNAPPPVHTREDGYVQSRSSQTVAALVPCRPGDRVLDLCAAPGGKATALARREVAVTAVDRSPTRARLVADNAARVAVSVPVVVADGAAPPFRARSFDHVLVDAPCSGLGALHRRPDARWRIQASDVADLAALQRRLLDAAIVVVRPGGTVTYSVCTLTAVESLDVDEWLALNYPGLAPMEPPDGPWQPYGRGARVLPQAEGGDGMCVFRYRLIH